MVTAYTLAFGSLLLLGGRLADLLGRKVTFLAGLVGFAGVSAIGGASVNFAMLVTARACQGAFAAILVPSALSLLTTTFSRTEGPGQGVRRLRGHRHSRRRRRPAAGRGADRVPVLAVDAVREPDLRRGGVCRRGPAAAAPVIPCPSPSSTSRAWSWSAARCSAWCTGARTPPPTAGERRPRTVSWPPAGCSWGCSRLWQGRAAHPLLPPGVVLDRNRGGAYASMFITGAGLFGTFFFLTFYMQKTLGFSPLVTGLAFLPISAGSAVVSNLSTIVLMPRFGPKPLVACGMLIASGAMVWLAHLGPHSGYVAGLLGPLIMVAVGMGMVIAPSINTGTFGVAPQDAGVASATVTVGQQLGASVGTSLLNTIFASAVASYLAAHLATSSADHRTAGRAWRWRTATTPPSGGSPGSWPAAPSSAEPSCAPGPWFQPARRLRPASRSRRRRSGRASHRSRVQSLVRSSGLELKGVLA